MTVEQILFYIFGLLALISAAGVVLNFHNTIYAALSLVVSMLSLAVLFIMLHAEFIGVLQVMVYAGAIMVLFLFVLMLLNLTGGEMGAESQPLMKAAGTLLVLFAAVKLAAILAAFKIAWPDVGPEYGTVRELGVALYTDYVLAVEVSGVLLLAGIVGAVVLTKQEREE